MSIDLGVLYRAARVRIGELVSRPTTDPDLPVPATPRWTVHDVVAHVSGVAADGTSGNMAGAPGEEWTAAQVQRSANRSIAELLEEWERTGQLMEGFLSSPAGVNASAAVMDIHTHEADLRHALGVPLEVPDDFLEWAGAALRDGFADAVAAAGLPPVQVTAPDVEWFRGRLGRRTEAEVRGFDWSAEPGPYLDAFFIFGRAEQSLGERP
ncbi:MAG: maleylpyruvate isomerase family mycothiol-dependent enzyme [Actinomycetota bacterium]|nr:maleylpyruvate isomerase family mycothiol-dependent enzyme [Actinomycetota bacterium]